MIEVFVNACALLKEFFDDNPWVLALLTLSLFVSIVSTFLKVFMCPCEVDFAGFFSFLWRKIKGFAIFILLRLGVITRVSSEESEVLSDE